MHFRSTKRGVRDLRGPYWLSLVDIPSSTLVLFVNGTFQGDIYLVEGLPHNHHPAHDELILLFTLIKPQKGKCKGPF